MTLTAYLSTREAEASVLQTATVVVVDVVRATTSMVEAVAHGARGIYPVASTEDAVRLAQTLGREDTLLAGERRGMKIEGFDLGNSPADFASEVVDGKRLVWSTTNGTAAFAAAQESPRLVAGAFTNLNAVADAVAGDEHVVVLCAGREGHFSIEDALCAGALIRAIRERTGGDPTMNDGARACEILAGQVTVDEAFLAGTEAGRLLAAVGLAQDLALCAEIDRHDVVPVMVDQALTRAGS
ncbi:MAG: 2-phosphosulfolactate phosphatase [Longimicrobiales bacterium]